MKNIADWLCALGLEQYVDLFARNGIDAEVLSDLTDQDLEQLGVLLGHRRKILRAIGELKDKAERTAAAPDAERRHLTVMFCDLAGSTALSAQLDPEDMREVIAAYRAVCASAIRTYGGFVARFIGDGVLAYFGYPSAHEDDAERAVRASLDIVAGLRGKEIAPAGSLSARIGIATGFVVIGELIGDAAASEQEATGDTPNLAARLQALAEPGTVVIADTTKRLVGRVFTLRDLGEVEVKGLDRRQQIWAVDGVASAEARFETVRATHSGAFVGREKETALLAERLQLAWRGEGQAVLICGEPGIGKSRLAAWLDQHAASQSRIRLRYQCSPYHTDSALYPFIAQIERAADIRPDDSPDRRLDSLEALLALSTSQVQAVAPLIASLLTIPAGARYPPLGLNPVEQRRRTLLALIEQLEGLARRWPVLLLFEDAHWADPTSIELLGRALDRIAALPVLAVATFRPEFKVPWTIRPNLTVMALDRFDRRESEAMIHEVTGGRKLSPAIVDQIVGKTDGIPLFIEELTRWVIESGALVEAGAAGGVEGPPLLFAVPESLQDSLAARLDHLAPVKDTAQVAAVIGREFPLSLLKIVSGRTDAELRSALEQLEDAELVFRHGDPADGLYSFKHALLQDAAYESLLKNRRQALHRRIAETIRDKFPTLADTQPEVVAHHFSRAGVPQDAVAWWGKAGERSLHRSAFVEAIGHFRRAGDFAEALPDVPAVRHMRLRLQIACGNALIASRGHHAAETRAAFARARELAEGLDEAIERFSAYYGLWVGHYVRGEIAPMRELVEVFLNEASRRKGSSELGVAHRLYGVTRWFQGDFLGARSHLEEALSIYDPERDRDLAYLFGGDIGLSAMVYLALVLWPLGEVKRARKLIEDGLRLAEERGQIYSLALGYVYKGIFETIRRDPARAMPHLQDFLGLSQKYGLQLFEIGASFLLSWARHGSDRADASAVMRRCLAVLAQQRYALFWPVMQTLLAEVEADAGRIESGLQILDDQLAEIERTAHHAFDVELHRMRGELLLRGGSGDRAAAEAAFRRAIEIAQRQHTLTFELRATLSLAQLYHGMGRHQAARDLLVPALRNFDDAVEVPEVLHAQRLLGIVSAQT
ncbi:MAG TPA: adenylate/guanylate cyclase domain-containing protein [Xanthobacteraceae bacterium]|nr:adenylate/guanylate cyclase domain-containing protein [Xanthobacteraceae bacterium]